MTTDLGNDSAALARAALGHRVLRRDWSEHHRMTRSFVRSQVEAGRWTTWGDHAVLMSNGLPTRQQLMWLAVLDAGPLAALASHTALELAGHAGFAREAADPCGDPPRRSVGAAAGSPGSRVAASRSRRVDVARRTPQDADRAVNPRCGRLAAFPAFRLRPCRLGRPATTVHGHPAAGGDGPRRPDQAQGLPTAGSRGHRGGCGSFGRARRGPDVSTIRAGTASTAGPALRLHWPSPVPGLRVGPARRRHRGARGGWASPPRREPVAGRHATRTVRRGVRSQGPPCHQPGAEA